MVAILSIVLREDWDKMLKLMLPTSPPSISKSQLQTIVRRSLDRQALVVRKHSLEALIGGSGEGSQGIYRVSGMGIDQGQELDWSMILKILAPPADLSSQAVYSPSGFAYWKREAEALASGLLDELSPGLSAPHCYEVSNQADGSVWLWMEEVHKESAPWPVKRYGEVARMLGAWQGRYLTGKRLPEAEWLTPRWWNQDFVEENCAAVDLLQRSLDRPWVRYAFPPKRLEALLWMWQNREIFYRILEKLPQVFCHRDVFGRNLMERAVTTAEGKNPPDTVLIDWAYAGIGAIGEELVPLVQATYLWSEVRRDTYQELEEEALAGYLEGLRSTGWQGDAALVRLGYAAASALRYNLGNLRFWFPFLAEESSSPDATDEPVRELRDQIDFWNGTLERYIYPLAYEAIEVSKGLSSWA